MIRRVIELALSRRSLVLAAAAAVLLFTAIQVDDSRVENLPEFNPPYVEVQTEALGLSAYEVEQLITVPLEADLLNGVAFVEDIRSQSAPSLSSIVMTFEPGTNILDARQLVQERLTQAAGLPNVSRAPAMVQPLSSESRIMMIGVTSEDLSLVDLGVLARWTIRPKLMGVDGVANVVVWGQREQQLQVQVDPEALAERDVALKTVVETAGNALWVTPLTFLEASTPGVGGFIDGPNQRIGIRHVPAISDPEDLASVVIDGHPDVTLGDVSSIVVDHQPLVGAASVGQADGLYLIIEKFPWSNTIETTKGIEAALAELQPGLEGVTLDTDLFRPANYIERSIDNVQLATLIAIALVVLALLLTGNWRRSIVALSTTAVAMAGAAAALHLAGASFNTMLVAGLAVGALVNLDGAIRDASAQQRARMGLGVRARVVAAARTGSTALVYTAVILLAATVPALAMGGAAGEFVPDVAYALMVALVAGFITSITVTPALSEWVLKPEPSGGVLAGIGTSWAAEPYRRSLSGALDRAKVVVAVGAAALLAGLGLAVVSDRQFVPDFRQTDLLVSFDAAPGVSLQEMRRVANQAADETADLPGVEQAGVQLGRALLSDEITNVNSSVIWLRIAEGADYDATINEIRAVVDGYPGVGRPTITTYANDRVATRLQTSSEDLVVRVYGEDPELLTEVAQELVGDVATIDGVENPRALLPILEPSIEIEVDLERAAAAQIKPGDVRRAAATLLSGIEVGALFEEQRVFEVVVWSTPESRANISDVENLLIDTPDGSRITLGSVADVSVAPNERIIERDAVSRYVDIVAAVNDRSVTSVENELREVVNARGLPFEFHVGFASDRADEQTTSRQVQAIAVAVAIAIVLLLQAALSSWRLAALAVVTTFTSLSGAFVALTLAGGTYSIGTMAGLLAVTGLALRGVLQLLETYESLQLDEVVDPGPAVVTEGAARHFLPTVAAVVAVVAVTLPFVVGGGGAGREVLHPLAVAVMGGSVTTALSLLFLLPVLYLLVARPATRPDELFVIDAADRPPPIRTSEDVAEPARTTT